MIPTMQMPTTGWNPETGSVRTNGVERQTQMFGTLPVGNVPITTGIPFGPGIGYLNVNCPPYGAATPVPFAATTPVGFAPTFPTPLQNFGGITPTLNPFAFSGIPTPVMNPYTGTLPAGPFGYNAPLPGTPALAGFCPTPFVNPALTGFCSTTNPFQAVTGFHNGQPVLSTAIPAATPALFNASFPAHLTTPFGPTVFGNPGAPFFRGLGTGVPLDNAWDYTTGIPSPIQAFQSFVPGSLAQPIGGITPGITPIHQPVSNFQAASLNPFIQPPLSAFNTYGGLLQPYNNVCGPAAGINPWIRSALFSPAWSNLNPALGPLANLGGSFHQPFFSGCGGNAGLHSVPINPFLATGTNGIPTLGSAAPLAGVNPFHANPLLAHQAYMTNPWMAGSIPSATCNPPFGGSSVAPWTLSALSPGINNWCFPADIRTRATLAAACGIC